MEKAQVMIIESIKIKNFQCFYGETPEIVLGKGCTVIHGRNGAGKSRLFNAFCWCFMNRYYETTEGWKAARGTSNLQSLTSESALANHRKFDVFVEIRFELDDEEIGIDKIKLRREFQVTENGCSDSTVTLGYNQGKDYKEYSDPETVNRKLDDWFDHEIRKYMWFQGETLDELVQFEKRDSLQELTKKISHYRHYEDLVQDAKAFLNYSKRKMEEQQRLASSDKRKATEIENELRGKRNELSRLQEIISDHEKNIKFAEENRNEAENIIERTASSAELLAKAKEADRAHERIGELLKNHRLQHRTLARSGELLPLLAEESETFFGALSELEETIATRKEKLGVINQSISLEVPSQSDLEKLIKAERCEICGTDAPEGSDAHKHMVSRLDEMINQSNLNTELKYLNLLQKELPEVLNLFERKSKTASETHLDFKKEEKSLEAKWVIARDKRRKANEKVVGLPGEAGNIETHKRRKEKAIEDQKKHQRFLDRDKERVFNLKSQIATKERELGILSPSENIDPIFQKRKTLAEFTLGLISNIRDQERELLLNNIEKEANDLYTDLLKGAVGVIATLCIDRNDMSMKLVDPNGDVVPDPNSANWMAAKIALITSILKLTKARLGQSYPMISDAATSDMDEYNAKNYVRVSSSIFDQTIIISKDFSSAAITEMSSKNIRFYSLIPKTLDGKAIVDQNSSTKNLMVEIVSQND